VAAAAVAASLPFSSLRGQAVEAPAASARAEAEEGLRLFQARDFEGAQTHLERSLALDGTSSETRFWLARTLQAQWRGTSSQPERSELAKRCLAEYEKVLEAQPDRIEAYQALIGVAREADDATALPVLERLAGDERLSPARRADALLALASRGRACAEERLQAIAEQPVLSGSSGDARACADRGLAAAEKGLALDPGRESLWRERANLFASLAQAAAVDGRSDEQADYVKRAGESRRRAEQIRASRARTTTPRSY
jgi:hypothetical protein